MITYAVIGRNVAPWLAEALRQAEAAAEPGDAVVFVDSASGDGSAALARCLGVDVLSAPKGKGRAVVELLAHCDRGPVCLLDGDIERSERNIAIELRDAWRSGAADMVIANFRWPAKREFSITSAIHRPLVAGLFPEFADRIGLQPLSGFRLVDSRLPLGAIPPGYGLEAHLNVHVPTVGGRVAWVDVGIYEGPVPHRSPSAARAVARAVGSAILDVAQAHGRLSPALRPEWEAWLSGVVGVYGSLPPAGTDLDEYRERLRAASSRALPPRLVRD